MTLPMDGDIFMRKGTTVNQSTALSPANCTAGHTDQCGGVQGSPALLHVESKPSACEQVHFWEGRASSLSLHGFFMHASEIIILPLRDPCEK